MMDDKTKTPFYLQRVEFTSPEDTLQRILGERYGERYIESRKIYFRSLDAHLHGEAPPFAHTITMEFVNRCNLSCNMCYIANHSFEKASLDFSDIKKLIDEIASFGKSSILLGVGSEGLLYKDLPGVVEYAKNAGIMDVILMTNGTLLTEEMAEFLVNEQISRLCISVDAATPETYEKVRGKNELDKLEQNILNFVAIRKKLNSSLPVLRLSFCVTPDNSHEQEDFQQKWEGVVDYLDYQKLADNSFVGREDEAPQSESPSQSKNERLFCTKPFGYLNIWSNGDISPCCNFYGKSLTFGNIADDSLIDVYNGDQMADLRQQMLSGNINKVCRVCMENRENLIDDGIGR